MQNYGFYEKMEEINGGKKWKKGSVGGDSIFFDAIASLKGTTHPSSQRCYTLRQR